MKKWTVFFLVSALLVLMLSGCGKAASTVQDVPDDKLSIVTTIFPPYDFARAITGDKAALTMLLPPGAESHSFEPTPQDIIKIQNCDIFIYVGGESDAWVEEVLESMDTGAMKIITLMDCIEVVAEEIIEGMEEEAHEHGDEDEHEHEEIDEHEHEEIDEHEEEHADEDAHSAEDTHEETPEYDEHVWTSPRNAKLIVQKIADTLSEIDAANASAYQQNTLAFLSELNKLDAAFLDVVGQAQRKTLVFGDRFPFRYFADAYGLEYFAAFPGCSVETEASAGTVAFLIDKIKAENIPVVFHIELGNEKMANAISEATGAKVLQLHAVHNITKADFERGVGYVDLMKQNVENLKEALF
ncbi:MAG: metal ABC transporter substrate-binding protein [Clostridia bacterium]|jgi:zinc transport system substrate-binding protein|nr:metal ABC transporter substrate-binding protein [Clostridia bacterium]